MSLQNRSNCLLYSLFFIFLLFFQQAKGQDVWEKTNQWLEDNITQLGGNAVLLVYKNDKQVYLNTINKPGRLKQQFAKRRGINIFLNENTPTAIASCSKWLSAVLVMTFVDEGKLRITDTIGKFLPVFTQYGKGAITIGDCLSHLTGTESNREDNRLYMQMSSMDKVIEHIAKKPLIHTPGTAFFYGSDGLQITASIIEKISGKPFNSLFKERIALPLGMKNTNFGNQEVALPAGGAQSSAIDYMKFLQMLLHHGAFHGKQILSPQLVKEMQINRIAGKEISYSPAQSKEWGYGYGEWTLNKDVVSSPGMFGSMPWIDNKNQYAAVLITLNLRTKDRQDRYLKLIQLVEDAVKQLHE